MVELESLIKSMGSFESESFIKSMEEFDFAVEPARANLL